MSAIAIGPGDGTAAVTLAGLIKKVEPRRSARWKARTFSGSELSYLEVAIRRARSFLAGDQPIAHITSSSAGVFDGGLGQGVKPPLPSPLKTAVTPSLPEGMINSSWPSPSR